ncbi:MAG: ATP-binding protein, partial [Caulobacteraceae bacterium]|nr:ATP-binding protein [Caulobacteraceae bacterium]
RVAGARATQAERVEKRDRPEAAAAPPVLNALAEGGWLERIAAPDEAGRALLARAAEATGLTARGWTRTLRLARTIADLEGATAVRRTHIAEALIYRRVASEATVRA